MLSPDRELATVASLLKSQGVPFALIGGWAVISWGFVRASDDIDFLADLSAPKRRALLDAMAKEWEVEWRAGGQDDPIVGMISAVPKAGGMPVEILVAGKAADRKAISRAVSIPLAQTSIPLVRPEDLVAMKLEAGGGQDYEDVRRLLELLAGKIDEELLSQCCKERRVSARLVLARSKS